MAGLDCIFDDPLVLIDGDLAIPGSSDSGAFQFSTMVCTTEDSSPSAMTIPQDFTDGLGDYFSLTFIFYFLVLAMIAFFIGSWLYKR